MSITSNDKKFKKILVQKYVFVVLGFIVVGFAALSLTRASTSVTNYEAESSSVSAPASVKNDSSASNGKYLEFDSAGVNSFAFTAAGDHGFGTTALASMDKVGSSQSDFYIALGDLSYSAGKEDEWCAAFKQRINDVEVLAGNHDVGESSGGDINRYIQFCPFTLGSLTGNYGKQYYFDYPQSAPLARFIMIAPGVKGTLNINYNSGGAGYNFTQNAINSAQAAGIKWIIVGMHKNCITMGNKSCEVGADIMNLLINERVDLILQGHDHNYQRSHSLNCIQVGSFKSSCVADSGSDGSYSKGVGSVIIINGEFGRSHYSASSSDSEAGYFAITDDDAYGITKYEISESQLTAKYLRSAGGSFADNFTITSGQ